MAKEMTKSDRAKRFIAQGVQRKASGRFVAQYGMPGNPPLTLKDDNGNLKEFDDKEQAMVAAMEALLELLNTQRVKEHLSAWPNPRVGKWTSGDFGQGLRTVGLAPDIFEEICGSRKGRVREWLTGQEAVPHFARILLTIFRRFPEAIDVARQETRVAHEV